MPAEAIDEPDRKRFFNKRRERDPLGEGFACTWRTRLIKVAAEVITRARRVIVRLSGSWPHLDHFLQVSRAVAPLPPARPEHGVDRRHRRVAEASQRRHDKLGEGGGTRLIPSSLESGGS